MPLKSKALVRARVRTQEGQGGGGEKREKHEAGNRDGTRNACRTLLLHSSTCIHGFYNCALTVLAKNSGVESLQLSDNVQLCQASVADSSTSLPYC